MKTDAAFSPLLERIRPILAQHSLPVYLVGGAVRDMLLGWPIHDLDFAVAIDSIKLTYRVADFLGVPAYVMDKERGVGRVVLADEKTTLDFTRFRGDSLEADLRDRDFTINAIAFPVTEEKGASLVDPTGGQADLAAGLVRQVHQQALTDDPVRALRAIRMALTLDFVIEPATETAVTAAAALLTNVSVERVRDELLKLLLAPSAAAALAEMARLSLLAAVLPEIAALTGVEQSPPHHEPVLAHTCSVLRWLILLENSFIEGRPPAHPAVAEVEQCLVHFQERLNHHWQRPVTGDLTGRALLRLGALFHDAGKKETQEIEPDGRIRFLTHEKAGEKLAAERLRRFHFSNDAVRHVRLIVAQHMRPLFLANEPVYGRRAIYRFFRDADTAGLDVAFLTLADHLATHDGPGEGDSWLRLLDVVTDLYAHYFQKYEETVSPPPLLDGNTLINELGLAPGREVGRLLALIEEAQAAGEIGSREEALETARKSMKRNN
jgi:putative nucleotidyltransferase with HDIG domain